jgi:2,3-bisphosphoglycerate-independent phosphoglycerate mutase
MDLEFIRQLIDPAETRIVLLVMDGLGGLPFEPGGPTALEAGKTPNLDGLAARSICGLHQPVAPGVTPGSGPSHLGLFGYDPIKYQVGRGVLSALGIGFDLQPGDVAARGNYCTLDDEGRVTDRRAGRIPTEKNAKLCALLRDRIELPGVECFVETVKEYRLLLVLRGEDLGSAVSDTDPQKVGGQPLEPRPLSPQAKKTAGLIEEFLTQAHETLADHHPANGVLLRGFSSRPAWPQVADVYGLKAAAIAAYPMYRGVAQLVGMQVIETGATIEEQMGTLEKHWEDFGFFFVHVKPIDSAGEDGDFERKVALIEAVDALIPRVLDLGPDVMIVTGDHSTPSVLKYHSWHPVPVLVWSKYCRADGVQAFGERACMAGGLGPRIPATDLMPLALANAGWLQKFGA